MQIKVTKTHPDAVIPTRGSAGAAGFDLTAVSLRRAADIYRQLFSGVYEFRKALVRRIARGIYKP